MINIPFFILVFFGILQFTINIVEHGESKGNYNAVISLISVTLELILIVWAIKWGNIF